MTPTENSESLRVVASPTGEVDHPILVPQLCLFFCDGNGGHVAPGRQPFAQVAPGQLLVRAPVQVLPWLQCVPGRPAVARVLSIDIEPLLSMMESPPPRFHSLVIDAPPSPMLARALWTAMHDGTADEQHALFTRLASSLAQAFRSGGWRPAPLTKAVARAREILHERFADELPLDAMARAVAMSKCHLVHLFHEEIGLPPHAYQIQLRVAHARRLLTAGTPPADVASLTGFSDQSHLTRFFKRIVGIPPARYAVVAQRARGAVGS